MSGDVGIVVCPVTDTGCTAATKEPKLKEMGGGRRRIEAEDIQLSGGDAFRDGSWKNSPRLIRLESAKMHRLKQKYLPVELKISFFHSPSLLIRLNNSTCSRTQLLFQYSNFACCWCNLGVCLRSSLPEKTIRSILSALLWIC